MELAYKDFRSLTKTAADDPKISELLKTCKKVQKSSSHPQKSSADLRNFGGLRV